MFYTDYKLQFPVRVEKPNPLFAKALQQAIGGVEGEIRVCLQYLEKAESPEKGLQGVMWSLLNTREFLLQH